jgi:uncharacterized protein YdhG (YjbR/CyaY superfamily)
MNMFKATKAKSVSEYLDSVPVDRKPAVEYLHEFIQNSAPDLESHFSYNMLGYGKFKYINYKKETIDWPIIAMANQKNYISVYVCALEDGRYLAEKYRGDLGKVSVGKSCIRFKKLEDINLDALKKIIKKASLNPGLIKG